MHLPSFFASILAGFVWILVGCAPFQNGISGLQTGPIGQFYNGAKADWEEDFSTIDKTKWTPEVTVAGGGNFEFQFYNDSNANLYTQNGVLFIKPGLTKDYALLPGQAVFNPANNGGSSPPVPATGTVAQMNGAITTGVFSDAMLLGCGRTFLDASAITTCPGWGERPFWWLDLGNRCTDNGKAYSLSYNACVPASGYFIFQQDTSCEGTCPAYWSMINPVTSARISTKNAKSFQYGRLEIRAKIPKGDWLWPAMWMLPSNQTGTISVDNPAGTGAYGVWPRSGEIDILEARGNERSCSEAYMQEHPGTAFGGVQSFASTLHWGPNWDKNAFDRTHTEFSVAASDKTLNNDFHIYGLRWNQDGMYTYIDHDSNHVLEVNFKNQSFWDRATKGNYTHCLTNVASTEGYRCTHTEAIHQASWDGTSPGWKTNAAPFDQPFYLILNVAIGGTAGEGTTAYFPDGWCDKPWHNPDPATDGSKRFYPVANFYAALSKWLPTWGGTPIHDDAALQVDAIRYWSETNAGTPSPLSASAGQ